MATATPCSSWVDLSGVVKCTAAGQGWSESSYTRSGILRSPRISEPCWARLSPGILELVIWARSSRISKWENRSGFCSRERAATTARHGSGPEMCGF